VLQRPGSISISKPIIVSAPTESYSDQIIQEQKVLSKDFTNEELEMAWRKFAETIPEQGRLTSFILSTRPHLTSATAFEVTVSNIMLEKEFNKLQPEIISFIRSQLQNSFLSMTIKVEEETEKQRANSPEDRFKIMTDENPALITLRNGLHLELD
jgi:DNA polymerase III subunit gamma/tau